jgi:crotonobetainyl-CoA hydratase
MGMMLTGRHISAQEAQSYGLVNEIVPLDDLIPTAERWAEEILACAPLSIRASKEATNRALCLPLDEALLASYPGMKAMRDSEDLIEGPKAFAEKRPPNWKGQ